MSANSTAIQQLVSDADAVGEHLLDQVEDHNPLLVHRIYQIGALAVVAKFNGSSRAFDLSQVVLESNDAVEYEEYDSIYLSWLAKAALDHQGSEGTGLALKVVDAMSGDYEPAHRAEILARVAEVTDNEGLREQSILRGLDMLRDTELPQGSVLSEEEMKTIMLRLGVLGRDPDVIIEAAHTLPEAALKFEFLDQIAQNLQELDEGDGVRQSLINAAVISQNKGVANPSAIVRSKFEEILTDGEMSRLLAAVHHDGRRALIHYFSRYGKTFPSSGIEIGNGKEFTDFNRLTTKFDAWVDRLEHTRFAIRAFMARNREHRIGLRRQRVGSYAIAASVTPQILNAIQTGSLSVSNGSSIDDILERAWLRDKKEGETADVVTSRNWTFLLIPEVLHGNFAAAPPNHVSSIHALRDALPHLSHARVELNSALDSSGDPSALLDSSRALIVNPKGVLVMPRFIGSDHPRRPAIATYKSDFFDLVAKRVERSETA